MSCPFITVVGNARLQKLQLPLSVPVLRCRGWNSRPPTLIQPGVASETYLFTLSPFGTQLMRDLVIIVHMNLNPLHCNTGTQEDAQIFTDNPAKTSRPLTNINLDFEIHPQYTYPSYLVEYTVLQTPRKYGFSKKHTK